MDTKKPSKGVIQKYHFSTDWSLSFEIKDIPKLFINTSCVSSLFESVILNLTINSHATAIQPPLFRTLPTNTLAPTESTEIMTDEILRSERKRSDTPSVPPIDSHYWPEIRQLLFADPTQIENLKSDCEICYLPLSVDTADSEDYCPGISILACGHIFGRQCLLDFLSSKQATRDGFTYPDSCPSCRKNLLHQECGHLALIPFLSDVDHLKKNLKAKCLGVDNGLLAGNCAPCSLKPEIGSFAFTILDTLSQEEKDIVGDPIIFTVGDSWGNQWLFHSREDRETGEFRFVDWTYRTGFSSHQEPDAHDWHPTLVNNKCRIPSNLQTARELHAWGPRRFHLRLALAYPDTGPDAAILFERIISKLNLLDPCPRPLVAYSPKVDQSTGRVDVSQPLEANSPDMKPATVNNWNRIRQPLLAQHPGMAPLLDPNQRLVPNQ